MQLLLVGAGACALARTDFRGLGLRAIAVAWVFGSLLVGAAVIACAFANNLTVARWIVGLAALALVVPVAMRFRRPSTPTAGDVVLLLAVAAMAAWLVVRWVSWFDVPLEGDELTIWSSKATALFDAGGVNDTYRSYLGRAVHHPDYPPLNPLLQLWMRIGHGTAIEGWIRWPVHGFDLAALLYLAGAVKARVDGPVAPLLVAGAFAATCIGPHYAESDAMIRLAMLMAADGAAALLTGRDGAARVAFPLGLTLLVASKHEGSALAVVIALAIVLSRLCGRPRVETRGVLRRMVASFAVAAVVVGGVWAWNGALGLGNDLFKPGERQGLMPNLLAVGGERIGTVLDWFAGDFLLAPRKSAFALLLAVASTVLIWRSARRVEVILPALAALGGTALYLLVFLGTPHDLAWHWGTAGPRVLGHLNFVAMLWAAAALGVRLQAQRAARADASCGPDPSDSSRR